MPCEHLKHPGRLGSTLILSALLIVVSPWSFASAQTSLTAQAQAIIAAVPNPGGGGGEDLNDHP